jgi:enterobacteria phage integrase
LRCGDRLSAIGDAKCIGSRRFRKSRPKLTVPLHPELAEVIAAWPRSDQRILTTAVGKPFTAKGFGNWMADKIGQSGVPSRCIAHGLCKAAARRLAEAGRSASEIAAITGHATLVEISRYTKAAEQRTLATADHRYITY